MTPNAPSPVAPPPKPDEEVAASPGEAPAPHPKRRLRVVWIVVAAVVVLLAIVLMTRSSKKKQAAATAARAQAANRAVPVLAVPATKGDIGAYLTGLGTVTAVSTVTVRSRVDGQLTRVAFQEGQLVRAGDLLAEIDPRPFQVQLMQAEGQRAKD